MSRSILLVTGSRSLVDTEDGRRWALAELDLFFPGFDTIVTGDARGPDTWAFRASPPGRCFRYGLDGSIVTSGGAVGRWDRGVSRPRYGTTPGDRALAAAWCLLRDRRMVKAVARRGWEGAQVECLALIDRGSKTHGAEYTATVAEHGGVFVHRRFGRFAPDR